LNSYDAFGLEEALLKDFYSAESPEGNKPYREDLSEKLTKTLEERTSYRYNFFDYSLAILIAKCCCFRSDCMEKRVEKL
jgi:hypothetical protein